MDAAVLNFFGVENRGLLSQDTGLGTLTKAKPPADLNELPILPVRDIILFPNAILPLTVGRPSSLQLINHLPEEDRFIGVVVQRDPRTDNPKPVDMYRVGTSAYVHKVIKLPNQSLFIFVEGMNRISLEEAIQTEPFLVSRVRTLHDVEPTDGKPDFEALVRSIISMFQEIVRLSPSLSGDLQTVVMNINDPGRLSDFITANLPSLPTTEKQELLESLDLQARLDRLHRPLARGLEVQQIRSKIQSDVQDQVTQNQCEYFLREQMKAIQKELGEADEQQDVDDLRRKIDIAGMNEEAKKEAHRELKRLAKMNPAAADYTVTRTYLDWLVTLPWNKVGKLKIDLAKAKQTLDEDHWDLEKIKERILEYLAVLKLKPEMKGPILCFVGPPGVGKTSLGKSIARALDRKFARMSLGGIHDEAEIRGHRRTYIGALPGQIIQGIRRAETRDPIFMLDEVDKIGRDFRGDPSSALLEVLDPEQNSSFRDNCLDVPFDLSSVLFICTANVLDTIPPALLDRMEVLELQGYTEQEKIHIAHRHLIRKQTEAHGLHHPDQIEFTDDALGHVIRHYTREAGVRNLERGARSGHPLPKAGPARGRGFPRENDTRPQAGGRTSGSAPLPPGHRNCGPHAQARRNGRLGLDSDGRGRAVRRSRSDEGRQEFQNDRPGRPRHAGVDASGPDLGPLARGRVWDRFGLLRQKLRPRARSGRRHSEGRALGRGHHGDRHRLGPHFPADQASLGHDR